MAFLACPHCLSLSIYPWMGFTTGQRYRCQNCEEISVFVLEFDEEEAFLAAYDAEAFQRPSLAVDVVLFGVWDDAVRVLLLRRPTHPFSGTWTLPGTFVGFEEDLPEAAARVLRVKLGLRDVAVEPFQTFGAPGRDPRTRIVTVAHLALVSRDRVPPDAGRWARVEVPWKGDAAGPIRAHSEGAERAQRPLCHGPRRLAERDEQDLSRRADLCGSGRDVALGHEQCGARVGGLSSLCGGRRRRVICVCLRHVDRRRCRGGRLAQRGHGLMRSVPLRL